MIKQSMKTIIDYINAVTIKKLMSNKKQYFQITSLHLSLINDNKSRYLLQSTVWVKFNLTSKLHYYLQIYTIHFSFKRNAELMQAILVGKNNLFFINVDKPIFMSNIIIKFCIGIFSTEKYS